MHARAKRTRDPNEELRELIAEANGAVKDLRQVLAEVRQASGRAVRDVEQVMSERGAEEMNALSRHLQKEMDRYATVLNHSVNRAREHIIKCLQVSRLEETADGQMRIYFDGPARPFDDQVAR